MGKSQRKHNYQAAVCAFEHTGTGDSFKAFELESDRIGDSYKK